MGTFNPSYAYRKEEEPIAYQEFEGDVSFIHCAQCVFDPEFPIYPDEFMSEMQPVRCDECHNLISDSVTKGAER